MAEPRSILTIGNFDGVHVGHAAILARARQCAGQLHPPARVVALAFDPHPATVLRPGRAPARLTEFADRRRLLLAHGADAVERLRPTTALLSLEPDQFIARLVARFKPAAIVEGEDFRFGRDRSGSIETLRQLGAEHGFCVEVVPPVEAVLTDLTTVTASSSLVRWLVQQGRVRDAAAVLGRPYVLAGRVVPGDRRGHELGFPTANLHARCLLPADGVYAALAWVCGLDRPGPTDADGLPPDAEPPTFLAAVSVGTKPTFDGSVRVAEAHLFHPDRPFPADAPRALVELETYGWHLRLALVGWIRDQIRFESPIELAEQMFRDCCRAQELAGDRAYWPATPSRGTR